MKNLSVIIITYNEEKNITDCIKSIKDIAGEIIVVDQKSDDKTVFLAKKLGAQVYSNKNYGHAEPSRNYAISKAKKRWILFLDADERITKTLREKVKLIIDKEEFDVIAFPRKNIMFNKWLKHTFWWPDYQIRLFIKGNLKWPRTVILQSHLQPEISGRILTLEPQEDNAIEHRNLKLYGNADGVFDMIKRYTKLTDFKNSILSNNTLTPTDLMNYMTGEFEFRFIQNQGYLDNMHGFILSKFMEFYRFAEIVYFWEQKKYPEMFTNEELKLAVERFLDYKKENELLAARLAVIKSSKFYKVWRFYCKYKDFFKKKFLGKI